MFMSLFSVLLLLALSTAELYANDGLEDDLLAAAASKLNTFEIFHKWMLRYQKDYGDIASTWLRFKVFRENVAQILELNMKNGGQVQFGLTKFADLTTEEFVSTHLMKGISRAVKSTTEFMVKTLPSTKGLSDNAEEEVDWTKKNVVTPVKDQGRVGTCYIFSALAVLESRWAQKGNTLVSLSAEEVADCLAVFDLFTSDNLACGVNGGLQAAVYRYVKDKGGISSEDAYPYCVGSGQCKPCAPDGYSALVCDTYPIKDCKEEDSCKAKYDKSKFVKGLQLKSWSYVSTDETEIAAVLAKEGPLAVALDARDLQFYRGGILKPDRCSPNQLNHAGAFVGYGTEGGTKFWKVKNSWGPDHGENGYYRIIRGQGACGINSMVTTADVR